MRLAEIPIEKVRTGFAYLKGEDGGRPSRRRPEEIEEPVIVIETDGGFEIVDGFGIQSQIEILYTPFDRRHDLLPCLRYTGSQKQEKKADNENLEPLHRKGEKEEE